MINSDYTAEYDQNLIHFIQDVRRDLDVPQLPIVIGQMGVGGPAEGERNRKMKAFKEAQARAATAPEVDGNVSLVKTDQYWDMTADAVFRKGWREHLKEWNTVGSDRPYHYLGSAICYSRIGKAFAEAVIELSP
jgi:alpha-galactosidase